MKDREPVLIALIVLQFALLTVDFLLGMVLNIFPHISYPVVMGSRIALGLMPHIAFGVAAFILSITIVFLGNRAGETSVAISSGIAALFIAISGIAGYLFAFHSGLDILSFIMAAGFLASMLIYIIPMSKIIRAPVELA